MLKNYTSKTTIVDFEKKVSKLVLQGVNKFASILHKCAINQKTLDKNIKDLASGRYKSSSALKSIFKPFPLNFESKSN